MGFGEKDSFLCDERARQASSESFAEKNEMNEVKGMIAFIPLEWVGRRAAMTYVYLWILSELHHHLSNNKCFITLFKYFALLKKMPLVNTIDLGNVYD